MKRNLFFVLFLFLTSNLIPCAKQEEKQLKNYTKKMMLWNVKANLFNYFEIIESCSIKTIKEKIAQKYKLDAENLEIGLTPAILFKNNENILSLLKKWSGTTIFFIYEK